MAHRTFTDSTGTEWDVWAVVPQGLTLDSPQRRQVGRDRRGTPMADIPALAEQRHGPDRRRSVNVSPGMEDGWLAFHSRGEKRRLAPIPDSWETLSSPQLEAYCKIARKVNA